MSRKVLVHIITGLSTGGAQMMLYKLLSAMDRNTFMPEVISLTDIGPAGEKIRSLGVPVRTLGMRRGVPNPFALLKLTRWLRQSKPEVIQTWMYHADLIGGLAAKSAGAIPVAWGIRHSNLDLRGIKRSTLRTAQLCARLSTWLPIRIGCCSEASKRVHIALGYAPEKMVVIPNGFDLTTFKPDTTARLAIRQDLSITNDTLLIGLIARFDPQKDHRNFVQAASKLCQNNSNVHFLLCGEGINWENRSLSRWIDEAGLRQRFHLLGQRHDIPRVTAVLDIATSSSFSEGFPNVIGEAMACGVPCVVTNVGDSALIVGDTGKVVPQQNSSMLASAWRNLAALSMDERLKLGTAARRRIEENFSLPSVVKRYEAFYLAIAS